ncbi:MAG: hypothetical protein P0Y51_14550 [Candidatus Pseudomonas colombiensis]|jgi:hypothetical protein|nr:hypothetical protein [Pseudomonas morbosilactucae]WEK11830.1 MAG: hypothetical protein P0Y51_14550 [Pseudomonas sp.]
MEPLRIPPLTALLIQLAAFGVASLLIVSLTLLGSWIGRLLH